MNQSPRYVMGIISSPEDHAQKIAHAIVEKKLAACAQITGRICSIYHWKNAIHKDTEVLIYLKTRYDKTEKINLLLTELHPYEVPEFVIIPLIDGNNKYFDWIETIVSQ